MTFLSGEDDAARRQRVKVTPHYTQEEIASRSRRKAWEQLPRLKDEIRAHYRNGEPSVTFVFIEEVNEYDAEILVREMVRLIEQATGFRAAVNEEASPTRASITVTLAPGTNAHVEHATPAKKSGRGSTPRFVRWVVVVAMGIAAIILILLGMAAGFKGPDKDGEILVFSGVGMVMALIVTSVLLFANDDSNHQDR